MNMNIRCMRFAMLRRCPGRRAIYEFFAGEIFRARKPIWNPNEYFRSPSLSRSIMPAIIEDEKLIRAFMAKRVYGDAIVLTALPLFTGESRLPKTEGAQRASRDANNHAPRPSGR